MKAVLLPLGFLTFIPSAMADVGMPADISTFIEKRESCDHFRGEEAYDAERKAFINAQLEINCKGTDKNLSDLKKKYAQNPEIVKSLQQYEENIE
jgi:hypothetical protein